MTDPLAQLDARRERYEQARQQRRVALTELKAALRAADQARVDGYPPRSDLITRSGLPRQTAYQALNEQHEY